MFCIIFSAQHSHLCLYICPPLAGCPDTGPQVEHRPEILPGTATVTWQAAQTSDPVLTTGMLYAVYSLCGSESSSYQLVAEAIEGLSYTVTGLPAPAQCTLRVVAYHRYCLQDLDGVLSDETLPFTTAIEGKWRKVPPYLDISFVPLASLNF